MDFDDADRLETDQTQGADFGTRQRPTSRLLDSREPSEELAEPNDQQEGALWPDASVPSVTQGDADGGLTLHLVPDTDEPLHRLNHQASPDTAGRLSLWISFDTARHAAAVRIGLARVGADDEPPKGPTLSVEVNPQITGAAANRLLWAVRHDVADIARTHWVETLDGHLLAHYPDRARAAMRSIEDTARTTW